MLSKKSFGWVAKSPDYISAKAECEQVRLMSKRELENIFSGAEIMFERVLGLPKSIMVIKKHQKAPPPYQEPAKTSTYLTPRES